MSINAGSLRHWVDVEEPFNGQDSDGEIIRTWVLFARIPASIEPLSTREFIAAQAVQSKVSARILIRRLDGVDARMRINHAGKIYNVEGILTDKDSGLEYITMPCSEGMNEGG